MSILEFGIVACIGVINFDLVIVIYLLYTSPSMSLQAITSPSTYSYHLSLASTITFLQMILKLFPLDIPNLLSLPGLCNSVCLLPYPNSITLVALLSGADGES